MPEKFYTDPRKYDQFSEHRVHPVHMEFVAVPSYFDIHSYLSIREISGQFMNQDVTLESITLMASAIQEGPIFTLSSPTGTYAASAFYVVEILKQIGLTVKAFSNFVATDVKSYEHLLRDTTFKNENGKPIIDMTIIFINLYKIVEEGVLEPIIKNIAEAEDYASAMEATKQIYKS
jgi:hypothetical protein